MFRRILKWVLWITGLLLLLLLLVAAGLYFTPNVVSTGWFRHQLETRASKALHRSVTVQKVLWTWKGGVRIEGLAVADDPGYGAEPLLSLDHLLFSVDFELDPRHLFLDVKVDGLKGNLIREKDGRTNLETWLAQINPPREPAAPVPHAPIAKETPSPFILPGDLTARMQLTHGQLRVEDRMENHLLEIQDGTFNLDMPSLLSKPIDLNMSSGQSMDGKALPPLTLAVMVDRLVDDTGGLNPQAAMLNITGELPGIQMAMKGSLAEKGVDGTLKMDLAPLVEAVQPFLTATVPKLSGEILFETKAQLQTGRMISFDLRLGLNNVLATGGPLKEKKIGPFSMSLSQKGSAEPAGKVLNLEGGEIHLMEKSGLFFKGRVKMEDENQVNVNLALTDVALHLNEIQPLAKGFIPEGIGLKGMENAQSPDFSIREVQLRGTLPGGAANLSVEGMALNLREINLAFWKNRLNAENLTFLLPHTAIQMKNRFPENLEMDLSMGAKNVHISGKQTLSMDECRISSLKLAVKDLGLSTEALWGVAGQITFEESGLIKGIRLPPQNDGTDHLSHGFKIHVELPPASRARVVFAQADFSTGPLKMAALLPHPLKEGLTFNGRLKDVQIPHLEPLRLDVGEFNAEMRSGDALQLRVNGAAADSGMASFRAEGFMGVDLKEALSLAPTGAAPKGRFAGRVETTWRLEGRRPTDKEIAALTDNTQPLEKRLGHGDFLKTLDLKTHLIDMAVTLPLKSGETLSAEGIHSVAPLSVSTANGLKTVSVLGEIKVDHIKALPSLGKIKTPLSAGISLDAVCRDLNSLEFQETLQLAPLAVEQNLVVSLNKLNRLLKKNEKPDLPTLLKILEAQIKAGINIDTGPHLASFTRGLALKGPLKGHLAVALRGGKSVSINTILESDGINAALPSKFTISDLRTHLQLEKTYHLAFGPLKDGTKKPAPALSLSVLQPEASPRLNPSAAAPLSQRLLEDLRGRLSGKPTLSFLEARLENKPFPIQLNNAQLQMRFSHSLPSIDYFQMGMMGGTLVGGLRILEHHEGYRLQMDGAFSGLDTTRLLQSGNGRGSGNQKGTDEDTQVSGRISLQVPITADAGNVMGNLDAVFRLTHIGARTLERFLYAMDPHENNESIVGQRALLKKGTPRWIEVVIKNGSLSLTGEVTVAGSPIQLPAIKRLNMTSLPVQKPIQTLAVRLVPLLKGLKILSADTLLVEKGGAIDFREDGK